MTSRRQLAQLFALALGFSLSAEAQFLPGNLAVLRLGDGLQALTNTGNSLFIDQFATNGTRVNTVGIPDNASDAMILSGAASSEGGLTRSMDKSALTFCGYNTNRGAFGKSLSSSKSAALHRGIATVNITGTYRLVESSETLFDATNPRCVVTDDGVNDFWAGGGADGIVYASPFTMTAVTIESSIANTRYVRIVSSNLFFSTQSGTPGIYTLASIPGSYSPVGLIKTAAKTNALFFTPTNSQPSGFAINSALTLAYVADQRTTGGGGIQKWTNNGSAWAMAYALGVGATNMGAFGVVADFSGASPVIFATTVESQGSNRLVRIVDTGASASPTVLAMAGRNRIFRGIDFAPDGCPTITAQPQNQVAATGSDVTFAVGAESPFALGYQWQKDSIDIDAATGSTLMLHSVSTVDQGSYRVRVSSPYASVTSDAVTLAVNPLTGKPTITTQPRSQTNSVGGAATFTVVAGGSSPLSYQWQFNSNNIAGATSPGLVLSGLSLTSQGYYRALVANSFGSTNTQSAYLKVLELPPAITLQPASQTLRLGSPARFSTLAGGTGPFTYQWAFNGVKLTDGARVNGAAGSLLTIENAQFTDSGAYVVTVTGPAGSTHSEAAMLRVVPRPSYIDYSQSGAVYTQNFNSLPNPGATSVNSANPVVINKVAYSFSNPFDFAFPIESSGSGGLGLSNTMAGWYGLAETAAKVGAHAGDQNTGGIISFGSTNTTVTNRSLGLLATSSTGQTCFGAKFINTSSQTLTQINVSFTGQLWRQQTGVKKIQVSYFIDSSATRDLSTNVTSYLTGLNLSFPTNAMAWGSMGALAAGMRSVTDYPITGWAPGAALWLVWQISSDASAGQGLGIDDFTFSASGAAVSPRLSIQRSGASIVLSWPETATGYQLESNDDPTKTASWTSVGGTPSVANGSNIVTLVIGPHAKFFRLKQ